MHTLAVHAHAEHDHVMHTHIMHAHAGHTHVMQYMFYIRINSDMPTDTVEVETGLKVVADSIS